jgi:hypothetical protein
MAKAEEGRKVKACALIAPLKSYRGTMSENRKQPGEAKRQFVKR